MLAAALAAPGDTVGEVARIVLIGGSCVTVGRLLAGASPALLNAGLVAMATIDATIIFGHLFDQQNAVFEAAVASPGAPQLQTAGLGRAGCDYGDFFASGLAGAVIAFERWRQLVAAVAMFLVSQVFNQLFLVTDILPLDRPSGPGSHRARGEAPPLHRLASLRSSRMPKWRARSTLR